MGELEFIVSLTENTIPKDAFLQAGYGRPFLVAYLAVDLEHALDVLGHVHNDWQIASARAI